jgi:putative nucleotidyltransferase with HDIG domain
MYTERYDEFIALLKERLDEYRFVHSLNVAKAARELAVLFGADEEKAYVAGLLHDATKCEKKEKFQEIKQ